MSSHQEQADVQESEATKARRTIHFSSGETLEEEDSEEEEEEERSPNSGPFRGGADRGRLSFKTVALMIGRLSLLACDFLGESMAGVLGLNASKYQYAIDQHQRQQHKVSRNQTQTGTETTELSATPEQGGLYGATSHAADRRDRAHKHPAQDRGWENGGYQADEHHHRKP